MPNESQNLARSRACSPRVAFPLGPERTDRLLLELSRHCAGEGGCHGPDHTLRVHHLALHIGRQMQGSLEILSAAALLHDIGRPSETKEQGAICHAAKGAELAGPILDELGFPDDQRDAILHCIASHRYRNATAPESLEAKILFDADKLDSIGAIGVGRAFLFAGQVGARLHNSDADIADSKPYSPEDTAYREFTVKLRKIRDRLLTPAGRELARERHAFMEDFFRRLDRESMGEW